MKAKLLSLLVLIMFCVGIRAGEVAANPLTTSVTVEIGEGSASVTDKVTIDGETYAAYKIGTSKAPGTIKVTVPAGATALQFYALSWSTATSEVTLTCGENSQTISATGGGISGNSPYTYKAEEGGEVTTHLYTYDFGSALAEDAVVSVTSPARIVFFGFNAVKDGEVIEPVNPEDPEDPEDSTELVVEEVEGACSLNERINIDSETYAAYKIGTSKASGTIKVTVPAGATALQFYALSWSTATSDVTMTCGEETKTITASGAGISGNSPYTYNAEVGGEISTHLYTYEFDSALEEETIITLTSEFRIVFFGFNTIKAEEPVIEPLSWSEVKNGCTYAIVNVQPESVGKSYYLYDVDGVLNVGDATDFNTATEWADAAKFVAMKTDDGKYTFRNVANGQYLAWRGANGGANDNKGFVDAVNNYSSWTMHEASVFPGTYWFVAKRANGNDGSLILSNAGEWNAWGNGEVTGRTDFSNDYGFVLLAEPEANITITWNVKDSEGNIGNTVTKELCEVGKEYTYDTFLTPYVTGQTTVVATEESQTIDLTFDMSDKDYTLKMNRTPALNIFVDPTDETAIKTVSSADMTYGNQDYFKWQFVGNFETGLALKNKATGSYVTFGSANPADKYKATLTDTPAEGAYFDMLANGNYVALKLHGSTNNAFISNNGGVGTTFLTNWNSGNNIGDGGAQIIIAEAEYIAPVYAEDAQIEEAKELLKNAGIGYPAAEAEARVALENLLKSEQVLADALETAVANFKKSSEIEQPANEATYALTFVAKDGNKWMLNNNEGALNLIAATDEVPATAKWLATVGEDGKVTFSNNDKLLKYDSLGDEEGDDTKWTIKAMAASTSAQIVAGSDLFGLVYFEGKRPNGNIGQMIAKNDGTGFAGTNAPFYNDTYTSAIMIEEIESEPEPEPEPEPYVGEITVERIDFTGQDALLVIFKNEKDVMPSKEAFIQLDGEDVWSMADNYVYNQFYVILDGVDLSEGEHTLTFPINSLKFNNKELNKVEITTTFTIGGTEPEPVLEPGQYFVQNVESGKFLSNGANWGTRSVLFGRGIEYGVSFAEGKYTLKSGIKNANTALRPSDGFNDQSGAWELIETEGGVYMFNGEKYFCYDGTDVPQFKAEPDASCVWKFVTADERKALLADASETNGVDATVYVKAADFHNADVENSAWSKSKIGGDFGSGCTMANSANCEQWNAGEFVASQAITDLPNGLYKVTCQGYTRLNGTAPASADSYEAGEVLPAYLFANDEQVALKSIFAEADAALRSGFATVTSASGKVYYIANGQNTAAVKFNEGAYVNELFVEVTDGTMNLGVKSEGGIEWVVFDSFRLTYYGTEANAENIKNADLIAEFKKLVDEAEDLLENKMDADIAEALGDAAAKKPNTAEKYEEAIENLKELIDVAKPSIEKYNKAAAYAKIFKENLKATGSTAPSDDVNEFEEALETGRLSDNIASPYETTYNELISFVKDGDDLISFLFPDFKKVDDAIANPDFEVNGVEGWTTAEGWANGNPWLHPATNNFAEKTNTTFLEGWVSGPANHGDETLSQVITLPAGSYMLTVDGKLLQQGNTSVVPEGFVLFAGDKEATITDKIGTYALVFDMKQEGEITIGAKFENATGNWGCIDNFQLYLLESYVAPVEVKGTAFDISWSGQPADPNADFICNFNAGYNAVAPNIANYDPATDKQLVIKFAEPLDVQYNTPWKNAAGEQQWHATPMDTPGYDIMEIDITEVMTDFNIQHINGDSGNTFTITESYLVKNDESQVPLTWFSPTTWGSSVSMAGVTSGVATISAQWDGVRMTAPECFLQDGTKTLRIYTLNDMTDLPFQWCITPAEGDAFYPAIGVDATGTYAEFTTDALIKSLYLQHTTSDASTLDIRAITWEFKAATPVMPEIAFSAEEGAEVDPAETKSIHISVALPAGVEASDDLVIEGKIYGKNYESPVIGFTDFEDGVDVDVTRLNPGNYTIEITKIAYGEVVDTDPETWMPICEHQFVAEEGEALASLNFSVKEAEQVAPEIVSVTVNPNAQIVAVTFAAEDANVTYNVALALETAAGEAVETTVAGEYGQNYGDMIYTFGEALAAGDYVLVLPAGSMTFSLDGTPFNAEMRIPFTVDSTVGINNVENTIARDGKFLKNGKVVIVKNGKTFSTTGARMK